MRTTRSVAILALVALVSVPAAERTTAVVVATQQTTPAPGTGEDMQVDLIKWAVTQGGLTLALLLTLWSYRREFLRRDEKRLAEIEQLREEKRQIMEAAKEEKRDLQVVLRENSAAMQAHAVAIQRNTDANVTNTQAIQSLTQDVRTLAERRRFERDQP